MILPVPWCDSFSFQLTNIFTRLRIVAKEKTREKVTKEVTSMTSIFTPHEDCQRPLVVLIEGEPGIGKTTYCQKLAYDWATKQSREWDESFPRVEALLLLRCREIESSIWEAIDDQVLPEDIEPAVRDTFIQFLRENPSKVLLVLDGLDEADQEKLKLIRKLIQRELLPGCFIVLTSRHEVGSNIRPHTDTLLEIVGFTRTDAECFIGKYFQQSDNQHLAETLIAKVRFSYLYELTRNPLNTLLLCVIFEDLNGVLPNSRTELYIEIVLFVLRRYENKNGLSSSGKDLLLVYKKELMILGRMALDSLRKGELYFEDGESDLKESLLGKFGFVSIQAGGSKRAPCPRFVFFHKSFQEFFSGFFLAFSIIDGTMDCKSVLTDKQYKDELFEVFTFMGGIVARRSEATAVSIVESLASVVSDWWSSCYPTHVALVVRFVEDCKLCTETLYTKLARVFGKTLDHVDTSYGVGFVPFRTLCLALTVNSTVTELDLGPFLFPEDANFLAQALRVNTSVTTLNFPRCSFSGDEQFNSLCQVLTVNTSVTSLNLHWNSVGDKGANYLSQALRVNTSLTSLTLSRCSIGDEGANYLSQALRVNTSLSSLDLWWNHIGDKGANSLSQALKVNTSLTSLKLSMNSIGDEGANSLSQALRINTSLTSLDLSMNSIGNEGANSLSQAVRVNTFLTSLTLSRNCIRDEGAISLSQALRVNTSFTSFDLSLNPFGDEGANSISEAIRVNKSLTVFNVNYISSLDPCIR